MQTFGYSPALSPTKTSSRLTLLNKLIKRKDVDMLINACDAGREGELIFTISYVMQNPINLSSDCGCNQ